MRTRISFSISQKLKIRSFPDKAQLQPPHIKKSYLYDLQTQAGKEYEIVLRSSEKTRRQQVIIKVLLKKKVFIFIFLYEEAY